MTELKSRTFESVLEHLKEGNERFVADKIDGQLQDSSRRAALTTGQDPYAIILSCADSRVVPELTFDTGLGELFVVRVAGNVSNISTVASIEYAVAQLGTPVLIVMGHESCGAVGAAIGKVEAGPNIKTLLAYVDDAIAESGEGADVNTVVKNNAIIQAKQILAKSAICRDAVEQGKLKIIPAYYNLDSGKVDLL